MNTNMNSNMNGKKRKKRSGNQVALEKANLAKVFRQSWIARDLFVNLDQDQILNDIYQSFDLCKAGIDNMEPKCEEDLIVTGIANLRKYWKLHSRSNHDMTCAMSLDQDKPESALTSMSTNHVR